MLIVKPLLRPAWKMATNIFTCFMYGPLGVGRLALSNVLILIKTSLSVSWSDGLPACLTNVKSGNASVASQLASRKSARVLSLMSEIYVQYLWWIGTLSGRG